MTKAKPKTLALALTGASGADYFLGLLDRLRNRGDFEVHLLASDSGKRVLLEESGKSWQEFAVAPFHTHSNKNLGAKLASGSFRLDGMAILPCSMNTLAAAAAGLAGNLILRCAAVQIKESRPLVLVPRETPLSLINLRAMVTLREAGAVILPASPGFYHQPRTIGDLVDTVVERVMDQLGIEDANIKRWNP